MINYDRILSAHVNGVQKAYSEYRGAMKKYLDNTWFDENGEFCYSVKCAAELHDAEQLYKRELMRIKTFKELLEEGDTNKINTYLAGEELC